MSVLQSIKAKMVSQTERGPIIPYKVLTHQNVLYLLWLVYVQSQTDMKCYLDFHWLRHYICTTQAQSQITITVSLKKKIKKNVQSHPLYWKKISSRIIVLIWFLFPLKLHRYHGCAILKTLLASILLVYSNWKIEPVTIYSLYINVSCINHI